MEKLELEDVKDRPKEGRESFLGFLNDTIGEDATDEFGSLLLRSAEKQDNLLPPKSKVLGVHPDETAATEKDPFFQMTPNVSDILTAIPGIPLPLTGIISGLGLVFPQVFKPRFPVVERAILVEETVEGTTDRRYEFGWYLKSEGEKRREGLHFGVAFLQVCKEVDKLRITAELATDWEGGDVDNQLDKFTGEIELVYPKTPKSPQITDFTNTDTLPIVVPRSDVRSLLAITEDELDSLINNGLDSFGASREVITKGSLIDLLKLRPPR